MAEDIRLVIWDLDETFWKGTLTEGGVTEYVQRHHDIVIELARRGIISSVCSRNDEAPVLRLLESKGIRDYFVFPSISWESKGPRLAALIEAIGLRPASCLFIDDNPSNLGEAVAFLPDLQTETEHFIPRLLDDSRFVGKDDSALSRLKQYQLLEKRHADEKSAAGDNHEFLRGCDIRVYIEHDVTKHIGRAVELINRTNQLNFTKTRLPEDPEAAKAKLIRQMANFRAKAGLVRVVDKYGDYGFVGFFLVWRRVDIGASGDTLYFCFSCRTLGMLVERWVYDYLDRPALKVAGEVLTDLNAPVTVDWIRLGTADDTDSAATSRSFDAIRIHGGCEATAFSHYLANHAGSVSVTANFNAGIWAVAQNAAALLLSAADRAGPAFQAECETLGLPYDLLAYEFFGPPGEDGLYIFCGLLDDGKRHRYRHKTYGWQIRIVPSGMVGFNMHYHTEERTLSDIVRHIKTEEDRAEVTRVTLHMRANYDMVHVDEEMLIAQYRAILDRLPDGARFVLVTSSVRECTNDLELKVIPSRQHYDEVVRRAIAPYPFAMAISFDEVIREESEIHFGGNHYERMVYLRLTEEILKRSATLPRKMQKTIEAGELVAAQ